MPHLRTRLDTLLVERGLAPTREKAQALVLAGQVLVDGQPARKPGQTVDPSAHVEVLAPLPYVSRGGIKLAHALDTFRISVEGKVCLDVGASTGGFTDCLLQRGARRVYAVDVGRGQLDLRLRRDPRVVVMEGVNARYPFPLPEPVDLITVDVSFISLRLVLPSVARHLGRGGTVLCLVKPQFEAPRQKVGKGGVVRDPTVHAQAIASVAVWAIGQGWRVRGITPSPILGDKGNREFFLWLEVPPVLP
ncbi:MAG: TlyA family RNA methyltransferase [Dehalococcoidia bacterium]|nr:TlyA family RNA methyltransferase [Dehalococcoidia bacterium]MDW8120511.1 TlyA family RNA methyltransferase [Chloroflexota bacterium]